MAESGSTIIKAKDAHAVAEAIPFNFEDMGERARRYLENVRRQAAQILAAAQAECAAVRKRAEEEGRRLGLQQAEQIVRQELEKKLGTLMPALEQAVRQVEEARHDFQRQWEKNLLKLACAIAVRMTREKLKEQPAAALALIREAVQLVAGASRIRIRLNPQDERTLRPQVEKLIRELAVAGEAEIIADESISLGGCRVETQSGFIDQQLEAQAARIMEELTGNL